MAETLFLLDGSARLIFDIDARERVLSELIREYLGQDCEALFAKLLNEAKESSAQAQTFGDDYEKIADGYLDMLRDTLEELDAILVLFSSPRLDRKKLHEALRRCRNNIYNNL